MVQALQNRFGRLGQIVRDAACFCVWAVARAYAGAEVGADLAAELAANVLSVAALDRDVAVRRCAAAAFQELAGRLRDRYVPGAVGCAGLVDYYRLGDVRDCYVAVAPALAEADGRYRETMVRYLSLIHI